MNASESTAGNATGVSAVVVPRKAHAAVTFVLGLTLVFTVGFVHNTTVHNGAHDTRHANGFPCH